MKKQPYYGGFYALSLTDLKRWIRETRQASFRAIYFDAYKSRGGKLTLEQILKRPYNKAKTISTMFD